MDKLSHFDFSFQKKLDKIVEVNWHECFEKNYGFGSPLEIFFDYKYGILGTTSVIGDGLSNSRKGPDGFLSCNLVPRAVPGLFAIWTSNHIPKTYGNNTYVTCELLHSSVIPIIFYISENWHNTLALIDKKVSEVVTLIGKKTDENRDKITYLQTIIDKQIILLESLETRLAEQQKYMEKIMESRGTIDKYIELDNVSNDPWCNIDE